MYFVVLNSDCQFLLEKCTISYSVSLPTESAISVLFIDTRRQSKISPEKVQTFESFALGNFQNVFFNKKCVISSCDVKYKYQRNILSNASNSKFQTVFCDYSVVRGTQILCCTSRCNSLDS